MEMSRDRCNRRCNHAPCRQLKASGFTANRPRHATRRSCPAPHRFFRGAPGLNNWNLALHKSTSIREGTTLQTRADFFNAFSHEQFANPNRVLSNSRFGVIGSRA